MNPAVQAVTFDVTGTLIHSPRLAEIYSEAFARHHLRLEPSEAARLIRETWIEFSCAAEPGVDRFGTHPDGARGWWARFLERLCEHADLGSPSPFLAAELFSRFGDASAWTVYADVVPALEVLGAAGLRLAIVSNWDHRLTGLLEDLEIRRYFEEIVYSQEVGVEKPHPDIFREALARLALEPEAVVHVGDRLLEDVEGAAAVGFQTLHLDRRDRGGDLDDLRAVLSRLQSVVS